MIRTAACILAAAFASLPFTAPLAEDQPLPRLDPRAPVSLSRRKDPAPPLDPGGEPELLPTLGTISNTHTGEAVPLSDAEPTAARFSDLLADKALLARIDVAPRLLEVLRAIVRAHPGARVDIVSGYRSPKRNEMMRKKGRHVASHSQHTRGQAVDFRVEGMGVGDMVKAIEGLKWEGGLGRYDGKSDLFVHVDVGPNRRWKGN